MTRNFEYTICTQADGILFKRQCAALEKHIPNLKREQLLEDVDGTLIQLYHHERGEVVVCNDCDLNCLYVESDFDLETYFK